MLEVGPLRASCLESWRNRSDEDVRRCGPDSRWGAVGDARSDRNLQQHVAKGASCVDDERRNHQAAFCDGNVACKNMSVAVNAIVGNNCKIWNARVAMAAHAEKATMSQAGACPSQFHSGLTRAERRATCRRRKSERKSVQAAAHELMLESAIARGRLEINELNARCTRRSLLQQRAAGASTWECPGSRTWRRQEWRAGQDVPC